MSTVNSGTTFRWLAWVAVMTLLARHFCVPPLTQAQTHTQPEVQYNRSLWKVQDGLPEATVQALVEMKDGFLWVGTTGGLTRFDGTHFSAYAGSLPSTPAVNSIFCLASAPDGTLWIGTEGGGLLHLAGNAVRTYTAAQGLTDGFVRSILVDHHGVVWAGTDSGLFQVVGDHVERIDLPGDPSSQAVHSLAEDREGRIWIGGSRLLALQDGRPIFYTLPGSYSNNRVKTILQTADGELWIGTVSGLEHLVNGHFEHVAQIKGTVRVLRQTSDGTLWIGTIGGGLWTYNDGVFSHLNGLLPSNTVLAILEDDDHQVWIGLQDGLLRLSRTPVGVIRLPGGTDADFATISGDGGDRLWAVTSQVYRLTGGVARPYVFKELSGVAVRNVFRGRHGELWVGTDGSGVYRIRPEGGTVHYSAPQQLTNNFIRAFLETRRGDIWVATDEGVTRITAQGIRKLGMHEGLAYFSVRSLLEDSSGDIWIGTDQGLSHWHGDHFLHDAATESLRLEKVWSILEDTHGTLWFGTRDHGIFLYRGGKLTHLTTLEGLISNSIYQILQDPHQRFWLSGPASISSIAEDQLQRFLAGANQHLSVSTYAMPYGAEDAQMYGGRQPSGYVNSSGVWFPSSKGVVHVVFTDESIAPPPRLVMEKVTLDGTELPVSGTVHVRPQMTRLEFHFAPLSLRSPTDIRYRYKLQHFDRTWLYASSDLTASYTNLPGGHYRLIVNAYSVANPSILSELTLDVDKDPYLWQTWWFLTLCVTVLSLIIWITHKARMHQVRLRFRAVLDERGRLAREMHDTVIQGCTSISALLEAIASTQKNTTSAQDDLLRHARVQVRTTINEARNTVWNLRHEDESPLNLVTSLKTIAAQTAQDDAIHVACNVEGEPVPIAGSVTRELLMVVREAVSNAVRHGMPHTITIAITFQPDRLVLYVTDDGIGFHPTDLPAEGHYGITGMRERMKQIGGFFSLLSQPGVGTEVTLSLDRSLHNPVPQHPNVSALISGDFVSYDGNAGMPNGKR